MLDDSCCRINLLWLIISSMFASKMANFRCLKLSVPCVGKIIGLNPSLNCLFLAGCLFTPPSLTCEYGSICDNECKEIMADVVKQNTNFSFKPFYKPPKPPQTYKPSLFELYDVPEGKLALYTPKSHLSKKDYKQHQFEVPL